MASRKSKAAGVKPAATQLPSTSASAPAVLADREGGASAAASSNGTEAQVVAGGASATTGGDQALVIVGDDTVRVSEVATTVVIDLTEQLGATAVDGGVVVGPEAASDLAAGLAILAAAQPSPGSAPQGLDLESADQPASTTDVGAAPEDLGDLIAIEGRSRDDRPYRRAGIVWTADWTPHRVTVAQSERLDADDHVLIRYL